MRNHIAQAIFMGICQYQSWVEFPVEAVDEESDHFIDFMNDFAGVNCDRNTELAQVIVAANPTDEELRSGVIFYINANPDSTLAFGSALAYVVNEIKPDFTMSDPTA